MPKKGEIWRHLSTNNLYRIEGFCMLEASAKQAVLYRLNGEPRSLPWARDKDEFCYGGFALVSTAAGTKP